MCNTFLEHINIKLFLSIYLSFLLLTQYSVFNDEFAIHTKAHSFVRSFTTSLSFSHHKHIHSLSLSSAHSHMFLSDKDAFNVDIVHPAAAADAGSIPVTGGPSNIFFERFQYHANTVISSERRRRRSTTKPFENIFCVRLPKDVKKKKKKLSLLLFTTEFPSSSTSTSSYST